MSKILLMHYFGGSGGKFITNCLCYSGQVAFPNFDVVNEFVKDNNISIINQHLLKTIPSRKNSKQWLTLEQGCHQLFGSGITNIKYNNKSMPDVFHDLDCFSNFWLPIQSHEKKVFDNICDYFSGHKIFKVLLQARPAFIDHAIKLKWPEKHHCLDLDQLNKFNHEIQTMDFDYTISDWDPRDVAQHYKIKKLADAIGITYDPTPAQEYINTYINFHHV